MKIFFFLNLIFFVILNACTNKVQAFKSSYLSKKNSQSFYGDKKLLKQFKDFDFKTKYPNKPDIVFSIQKNNYSNNGDKNDESNLINTSVLLPKNGAVFYLNKTMVSFENHTLNFSKTEIRHFYGTKLFFESVDSSNTQKNINFNWKDSLYVPKPLVVTNLLFTGNARKTSRKNGQIITWIPDLQKRNFNGVIIRLDYNPIYEKLMPAKKNYPNYLIDKYIIAADIGSYQISKKDLKGFPYPLNGLGITIYRGNFLKPTTSKNKIVKIILYDSFTTSVMLTE